jgi:hypothetical protein
MYCAAQGLSPFRQYFLHKYYFLLNNISCMMTISYLTILPEDCFVSFIICEDFLGGKASWRLLPLANTVLCGEHFLLVHLAISIFASPHKSNYLLGQYKLYFSQSRKRLEQNFEQATADSFNYFLSAVPV